MLAAESRLNRFVIVRTAGSPLVAIHPRQSPTIAGLRPNPEPDLHRILRSCGLPQNRPGPVRSKIRVRYRSLWILAAPGRQIRLILRRNIAEGDAICLFHGHVTVLRPGSQAGGKSALSKPVRRVACRGE